LPNNTFLNYSTGTANKCVSGPQDMRIGSPQSPLAPPLLYHWRQQSDLSHTL